MKVVAILQARIDSTRLPAKVLLDLAGTTVLGRCVERAQRFAGVDEVVIATTSRPVDDVIVALAKRLGVRSTRGSVDDVLARYLDAARETSADVIVRCTSDNPLVDPELSSAVVKALLDSRATSAPVDYAANNLERRLPLGLDLGVVTHEALLRADRSATVAEREHVTLHVYRHPEQFRILSVVPSVARDYSGLRWTCDTLDDYRFLATIFDRLGGNSASASMMDVIRLIEEDPSLATINSHVAQKVPG